jgi:V8-like Glu-specific endopeptidase
MRGPVRIPLSSLPTLAALLALAAFGAISALLFADEANAAVFGRDDRGQITEATSSRAGDQSALHGGGRIRSSAGTLVCTAFCVADDVIATAAHCLVGVDVGPRPALDAMTVEFRGPGGVTRQSALASRREGASPPNIIAGVKRLRTSAPINAAGDWAVARLAEPVCRGRALTVAATPADNPAAETLA